MSSRRVVLLCALALPVTAVAREYVVVPRDAALHRAPDEKSPAIRVASHAEPGAFLRLRRLGDAGAGWLAVETDAGGRDPEHGDAPGDTHCHATAFDGLAPRLFVRAADVARVTTRAVDVKNADGTSLHLSAGVAVGAADAAGVRSVAVDGFRFRAHLPADAIGDRYDGHATLADATTAQRMLPVDVKPTLDGAPLEIAGETHVRPTTRRTRRGLLVELVGACGRYDVLVPSRTKLLPWPGGMLALLTLASGDDVTPGATVYWPDGAVAGRAEGGASLDGTPVVRGGRSCYRIAPGPSLDVSSPDRVELCFDPRSITHRPTIPEMLEKTGSGDADPFVGLGEVATVRVNGAASSEAATVLATRLAALRACLDGAPAHVTLDLAADGHVVSVGPVGDTPLRTAGCILRAVHGLHLPGPPPLDVTIAP